MKKSKVQESDVPYVKEEKTEAELLLMCLKNELENRKRKCLSYQEKFDENFINAFKFYGEDMYVQTFWVTHLSSIISGITYRNTISESFTKYLNMYEGHLKSFFNVRVNSTSALIRESSIYEYQTFIQMHSYLLSLKKAYPKAF